MKTQVVQFQIDSGNGSMEATITARRLTYDDSIFHPEPPAASDVPEDVRVAVMQWLDPGLLGAKAKTSIDSLVPAPVGDGVTDDTEAIREPRRNHLQGAPRYTGSEAGCYG
jgi:hypothetical protein